MCYVKLKKRAVKHIDNFFFFSFIIIVTFGRLSTVYLFRINLNFVTLGLYDLSAFWSSILFNVSSFLMTQMQNVHIHIYVK